MIEGCKCNYCKKDVNEYFCSKCFYNFNRCEVNSWFHEAKGDLPSIGISLCPKCHPKNAKKV